MLPALDSSLQVHLFSIKWLVSYCRHHYHHHHHRHLRQSLFVFDFFETGPIYVDLAPVLELALKTKLPLNSQGSACLCLLITGIKDMHHHLSVGSFLN